MSKKRELFYIIALVVSLLTNVGTFLLPHPAAEPIAYYTNGTPDVATANGTVVSGDIQESVAKEDTKAINLSFAPAPTEKMTTNEPKININTAQITQLIRLPGVGESTAQKIIDYRTNKGTFKRIQDLMLVTGIGEKKFADMRGFIAVE